MSENIQSPKTSHEITGKNRKTLTVTGVEDVDSFDDASVRLNTVCGELVIDGNGLKVTVLDTARGNVSVDGNIQAINYYDKKLGTKRSIFGKKN